MLPGWLHSGLLSRKFQGTLRSPTFTISENFIHLLTSGADVRMNVVVDNFKIIRNPIYGGLTRHVKNEKPHWVTFNLGMWKGHECYVEIADLSNGDPGGKGSSPDAYGAVQQLWLTANNRPPAVPLPKLPEAIKLAEGEATRHFAEYNKLAGSVPRPVVVPVMLEGSGRNEKLFVRGNHKNLGAEVPRQYLTALVAKDFTQDQRHRPSGTGARNCHLQEPADRARVCQPDLASSLRPRPCVDRRQLWYAWGKTDTSQTARLACPSACGQSMVHQETHS